jgi:hypothetical protein
VSVDVVTGKSHRTTPAEPMILVLAQEPDRTADGVVLGLVERGEPVVGVDLTAIRTASRPEPGSRCRQPWSPT